MRALRMTPVLGWSRSLRGESMYRRILVPAAFALLGCSGPQQAPAAAPAPAPAQAPAPVVITVPAGSGQTTPQVYKNQPPGLKLKLGHYSNSQMGIGVV